MRYSSASRLGGGLIVDVKDAGGLRYGEGGRNGLRLSNESESSSARVLGLLCPDERAIAEVDREDRKNKTRNNWLSVELRNARMNSGEKKGDVRY